MAKYEVTIKLSKKVELESTNKEEAEIDAENLLIRELSTKDFKEVNIEVKEVDEFESEIRKAQQQKMKEELSQ